MQITTIRFGTIDYDTDDVISFPTGLVGFPQLNEFLLVSHKEGTPFRWLQSISDATMAFLVADPTAFVQGYSPLVSDQDAAELQIDERSEVVLLTTVSIPHGEPNAMSINLAGPIVVNAATRTGKQVVLDDDAYTVRHRVFPTADQEDQALAA